MIYKCGECNAEFKTKFNYERHINGKFSCNLNAKEQYKLEQSTCEYCNKVFSGPSVTKKHMTKCKNGFETEELKQMIADLKLEVQNLAKKDGNVINVQNNTNTNNNVQNIYGILPFGKENMDHLTLAEYNKIFKSGWRAVPTLIELVHCNKDKPENMNMYIGNFKDEYMYTFDGIDWNVEKKEDVLYNLYNSKRDFLESKYNDLEGSLSSKAKYFHQYFIKSNESSEDIKIIKDDIKNALYKNRLYVVKNVQKKPRKQRTKKISEYDDPNSIEFIPDKPLFV